MTHIKSDWHEGLLWAEDLCKDGEGWGAVPVKIMLSYVEDASWSFEDRESFIEGAFDYADHIWHRVEG